MKVLKLTCLELFLDCESKEKSGTVDEKLVCDGFIEGGVLRLAY